jgi:hypothetical protein
MTTEVTIRIENTIYDQFMGFVRLNKQVEIVGEKACRKRHKTGRPKHSNMPIVKAFRYESREQGSRLVMLCQGLKALRWIDSNTDMQLFIDLFSGGEVRRRVIWTGETNALAELFRRLVKERRLISLPPKHSLWTMVNGHFWDKEKKLEFGADHLRMTHCPQSLSQTIDYMVDILDPKCSLEEICKLLESQR